MSYIGQAPGLGQRSLNRFVASAGQTTFSGPDANGYPLGYTPGMVDVFLNSGLVSPPNYTATDGSTIVFNRALSSDDEVQILAQAPFSPANTYTMSQADALYTKRRNRIIDPGMRVSQENGNNLLTLASGSPQFPSDGFLAYRQGATGGATAQRVAVQTPGGSPYRLRMTVTAANASPGTTDQLVFQTMIEGVDIADLRLGTITPRTVAIRLGCRSSVAGTFGVAVLNGVGTRSWVGSVTIAQGEVGQDVIKSVTLQADQTGTWDSSNGRGLSVYVTLCAGSGVQGVAGWQAGAVIATASCTNLMATNGATFDLFDVGLYDVTGLQSGVIPPFELGSYAEDLLKCQRYYEQIGAGVVATTGGVGGFYSSRVCYKATKRVAPSVSLVSPVTNSNVAGNIYVDSSVNYADGFNSTIQANAANTTCYAFGIFAANARL
jgi:hypothetical protein